MSETPIPGSRKWYQKKRYLMPLGTLGLLTAIGAGSNNSTPESQVAPIVVTQPETPAVKPIVQETIEPKIETVKTEPIKPKKESSCNPNYSGCLKANAGDYDCSGGSGNGPNYTGAVEVLGYDEYDLDRDSDGWGCEKN